VQALDTAGLRGLDIHLQEASVEVPTEETDSLVLSGLVPSLPDLESDPQLEIRPTSVTVILYGPASLVSRVDPEDLEVTITSRRSTLAPGEETTTGVEVGGLSEWVTFRVDPPWIILLRPVGQ
jgi:hypothetical protein